MRHVLGEQVVSLIGHPSEGVGKVRQGKGESPYRVHYWAGDRMCK